MIDILYLAKRRSEFTAASLRALIENTPRDLARLHVFTDGVAFSFPDVRLPDTYFDTCEYGGPVAIMNHWIRGTSIPKQPVFAKIDNDVIVPPGWLETCLGVMNRNPELDLLGIEPPLSRTPAPWANGKRIPAPEEDAVVRSLVRLEGQPQYARCEAIGGIGLMRLRAFEDRPAMKPHSIYGGFTDWQREHKDVVKGWIAPPLPVFLLDRLPMEPWASLSKEYIAKGWQRPWTNYRPEDAVLWDWWTGAAHGR